MPHVTKGFRDEFGKKIQLAARFSPETFQEIRALAESCARQLTAWTGSIEGSPVQGKRHLAAFG